MTEPRLSRIDRPLAAPISTGASAFLNGLSATKSMTIVGDDVLFINVGQEARAYEFMVRRGEEAYIVKFRLSEQYVNKLRSTAVKERDARSSPDSPIQVDTVYPDQYGIRSSGFQEFVDNIVPDSVEIAKQ